MFSPITHRDSSYAVIPEDAYPAVESLVWMAVFMETDTACHDETNASKFR